MVAALGRRRVRWRAGIVIAYRLDHDKRNASKRHGGRLKASGEVIALLAGYHRRLALCICCTN